MKKQKLNYILEEVRKKGRNGDTILAHINPIEAIMLKNAGGSGTINPKTGLPEFGGLIDFFENPAKILKKTFRSPKSIKRAAGDALGIAGAVFGGPVGAAAAGAVRSAIRKENPLIGALKGAGYGIMAPMAGNLAGQGLSKIGFNSLGSTLQNYGTNNMGSWFGNMAQVGGGLRGLGLPFTGAEKSTLGTSDYLLGGSALSSSGRGKGASSGADYDYLESYQDYLKENGVGGKGNTEELSFFDKLKGNTENFLTKPKNLLALGSTGLQLYDRMNQPKPLTAAQKGRMAKEEMLAARLTPQELAEQEQYELAVEQARRRNARKKFLPEERIDITPLYNRVSSPEEYAQTGRWINYYNNPQFTGQPVRF